MSRERSHDGTEAYDLPGAVAGEVGSEQADRQKPVAGYTARDAG